MSALRVAVFALVAVAVAVAANLALLGLATGPRDPVGTLSPRAGLVQLPAPPAATTTTATIPPRPTSPAVPPRQGESHSHQDD